MLWGTGPWGGVPAEPPSLGKEVFLFIQGNIFDAAGRPKENVSITVERERVDGTLEKLASGATGPQGSYVIKYGVYDPDCVTLRVSLYGEPGAPSRTIVGPAEKQFADFWLGQAKSYVFTKISDRLQRVLDCDEKAIDELDQVGLARLALAAGVSPKDAFVFRDADASATLTSLPSSLFFALAKGGLTARVADLVKLPASQRQAALDAAIAAAVLSEADAAAAANALPSLDDAAVESALVEGQTVSSPAFAMALAGIDTGREEIIAAWRDFQGSNPDFWASLTGLTSEEKADLQFALQLQSLTRAHAPLMTTLFAIHDELSEFVALELDDWVGHVQSSGVPTMLLDAGVDEASYAAAMFGAIEDAFPTRMLAARNAWFTSGTPLQSFLDGNPDYALDGMSLRAFLRLNPDALEAAGTQEQQDAVAAELPVLERLYRISPRGARFETMRDLRDAGIVSATQIQSMGRTRFLAELEGTLGFTLAAQVFRRARSLAGAALMLQLRHGASSPAPGFAVLPIVGEGHPEGGADILGWEDLFGNRTFCGCEHCQSSTGPAAYLADLLFWLDTRATGTDYLDVLRARRPDIEGIELSCKNANTVLPTIDLILEQLEAMLEPIGASSAHQTTLEAGELAARPEYIHEGAYDRLAGKDAPPVFYPFEQPYLAGLDHARTFLSALGVERSVLQLTLTEGGVATGLGEPEIAAEVLGMTRTSWAILAGDLSTSAGARWGVADTDELSPVTAFLRQAVHRAEEAPLAYADLEDLLRSRYVQEAGGIDELAVVFANTVCDISDAQLVSESTDPPTIAPHHLDRLAKLIRLSRDLGWSVRDTDRAIEIFRASGPGPLAESDISESLLLSLAAMRWLSGLVRRGPADLLGWFGPLDTRRWAERLQNEDSSEEHKRVPLLDSAKAGGAEAELSPFQKLVGHIPDVAVFAVTDDGAALDDETHRIGDHLDAVASVVGIDTDELVTLANALSKRRFLHAPNFSIGGTETLTRVVMFRLDAVPSSDQFLFSTNPTSTTGWALFVNTSGELVWQVEDGANAIESSALTPGQTYVAAATYDGTNVHLQVNAETVTPAALTGGVGAGSSGLAIGAKSELGDAPADDATILGCAASDNVALSGLAAYVDACLARGEILPFEDAEHLYLASEGLHRDQIGELDFTVDAAITLANLSQLHRQTDLARALRLGAEELLEWQRRTGIDPFVSPLDAVRFVLEVHRQRSVSVAGDALDALLATPGERDLAPLGMPSPGEALLALSDEVRSHALPTGEETPADAESRSRAVIRRIAALLSVDGALVDAILVGLRHGTIPLRDAVLEAAQAVADARDTSPVEEADPEALTAHFDPSIWEAVAIAGWLSRAFSLRVEDLPWLVGSAATIRTELLPDPATWTPGPNASATGSQADPDGGTDAVSLADTSGAAIGDATVSATSYAGGPVVADLWVKKNAAATTFAEIRLGFGTSDARLNLHLGTGVTEELGSAFDGVRVAEDVEDWWLVTLAHAGDRRSTSLALEVFPARGLVSAFPSDDVSATGSVVVYAPSVRARTEWEAIIGGSTTLERFAGWASFREAARLQTVATEGRFFDLLGLLADAITAPTAPALRTTLAERTGWKEENLLAAIDDSFAGPLGGASAPDWASPERMTRLAALMEQARGLGVSAAKLAAWGALAWLDDGFFDDPIETYRAHAKELEQSLRAVWGDERWLADMPKVRDGLRERQRDALISKSVGDRFTTGTSEFSGSDYLSHADGELEGSSMMTRVVMFRLDASPSSDQFLFSAHPTASTGWGLYVNGSDELVWKVHNTLISSSALSLGQTYVAVAQYDGANLLLQVNEEVATPVSRTGAVGTGANGIAIGASNAAGASSAADLTIIGCAASDTDALADPSAYITVCLARGEVQPFEGIEHLYAAKFGLEQDRVGDVDFTVNGTLTTGIVESASYTADDLAQALLMDLQMGACARTSRLVDATRTVQLFVQRILLGQEAPLELTEGESDEWVWRKNYRVWEANRKVFLYPENWLLPELRRDKTPFFVQLESEIAQGDLSDERVEAAYRSYLRELATVAKLETVAMFREPREEGEDVIHVFARTRGVPQTYYHRQWIDGGKWTPWQPVTGAKIEGQHLLPTIFQRRLILFWLTVSETAREPSSVTVGLIDEAVTAPVGLKYFHIRLAWSELRDGQWSPATQSDTFIGVDPRGQVSPADAVSLNNLLATVEGSDRSTYPTTVIHGEVQEDPNGRDLLIQLFRDGPRDGQVKVLARFRVSGVDGSVTAEAGAIANYHAAAPYRTSLEDYVGSAQRFWGADQLFIPFLHPDVGRVGQKVLEARSSLGDPAWMHVTPTSRVHFDSREPFVFEDPVGSYWVTFDHRKPFVDLSGIGVDPDVWNQERLGLPPATGSQPIFGVERDAAESEEASSDTPMGFFLDASVIGEATAAGRRVGSVHGAEAPTGAIRVDVETSITVVEEGTGTVVHEAASGVGGPDALRFRVELPIPAFETLGVTTEGLHVFRDDIAFFRFHTFFHPHVAAMREALNRGGVFALLTPKDSEPLAGQAPTPPSTLGGRHVLYGVANPLPADDLDFTPTGAYSQYNWELFFHAPFLIAARLHEAGRFAEALNWLHAIFDPTRPSAAGAAAVDVAQSCWRFRPFREEFAADGATPRNIVELIALLTADASDPDALDTARALLQQITDWRRNPFDPHAIARVRTQTYMAAVVMRYLDVLIDWGDAMFAQDTRESVAEAAELYLLAARILGPRQESVDAGQEEPSTFAQLLDRFREGIGPAESLEETVQAWEVADDDFPETADSLPSLLYFCTPPNPQLASRYWDRVADRLFKIRNCLDIEGQRRELDLFAPPIDPALLVRAAAAGVDLRSLLSDVTIGPVPHRRYAALADLAGGLAASTQALGQALLSAIERRDADQLAVLRSTHERKLQEDTIELRREQLTEAQAELEALSHVKANAQARLDFYLEKSLENLNAKEKEQIAKAETSKIHQAVAVASFTTASLLGALPNFDLGAAGAGGSPVGKASWGGGQLAAIANGVGQLMQGTASMRESEGRMLLTKAGYERRKESWDHQAALAQTDLDATDRRSAAADIRVALATRSLAMADTRLEQINEIHTILETRFGREELYDWLAAQLSSLHYQSYQLAFEFAKRAERAWQYELGREVTETFIGFGYWDDGRRGLLAAERLAHDLRRMQVAYIEIGKRRLEVDQTFSLREIDPVALIALQETGEADLSIPEAFFDLYYPGHYRRRIRAVRVTVPAVVPPNTNLPVELTLGPHTIRKEPGADPTDNYGSAPMLMTATSSGQRDAGVFELNFGGARLLPFEGAGAISQWTVRLPKALKPFDYRQIQDVLLHLAYDADHSETRRTDLETGDPPLVRSNLLPTSGSQRTRVISLRTEFGGVLRRLIDSPVGTEIAFEVTAETLPAYLRSLVPDPGLTAENEKLVLRAPSAEGLQLKINNGSTIDTWAAWSDAGGLPKADISAFGTSLIGSHVIEVVTWGTSPSELVPGDDFDIMIVVDLVET